MKKVLKWTGIVVAVLVVVLVIAGVTLMQSGKSKFATTYTVTGLLESVSSDSATIARGRHIVETHYCLDCHGESLQGRVFADAPPFLMVAPNLTSGKGGVSAQYKTVADWDRTIRNGVRPNGTPVLVMPSKAFHHFSDADAAALIAYIQSLPPVDNELPASELRPLGQLLLGLGQFDMAMEVHTAPARAPAPPPGETAEYGGYIVSTLCSYCHGEDLQGGPPLDPETPPPPSLAAASAWSLDLFKQALRTGVAPDGRQLNPLMMPPGVLGNFTDEEIAALHLHLKDRFTSP